MSTKKEIIDLFYSYQRICTYVFLNVYKRVAGNFPLHRSKSVESLYYNFWVGLNGFN